MIIDWIVAAVIAVVAAVISYSLVPKPQQQQAGRRRITDQRREFNAPTSDAGRPIPVVFGTVTVKGPNVLHFTDKSRRRREDYDPNPNLVQYYMSVHYGICLGPIDALHRMRVSEKTFYGARVTGSGGSITIDDPEFSGGLDREGGMQGNIYWKAGTFTQTQASEVASRYGSRSNSMPGYRGIAHAMFYGDHPSEKEGFYWSANSPFIPPVDFMVSRVNDDWYSATARLSPPGGINRQHRDPVTKVRYRLGYDMNAAHIIRECLTDTSWGLGLPVNKIDDAAFRSAADTFFMENLGLSFIWTREAAMEDFLQEVLEHCSAVLYVSPTTGQFVLKALRGDYDPATLPIFDESNSQITNLIQQTPAEIPNELTVLWTSPFTEEQESISIQNLGGIQQADGNLVSETREYNGIRNVRLAWQVAERDIASLSEALLAGEMEADRSAWSLVPGNTIKVTSAEHDLDERIMRVLKVDYGRPGDAKIKLDVVEDLFGRQRANYATPGYGTPPGIPQFFGVTRLDGAARLNWSEPETYGGSEIIRYEYEQDDSGIWTTIDASAIGFIVRQLVNGQTYRFRLRAVNDTGEGEATDYLSVTPSAVAATAPSITRDLAVQTVDSEATLFFVQPSEDNGSTVYLYQYQVDTESWVDVDPEDLLIELGRYSFRVTGLVIGNTYDVHVRAVNYVDEGPASNTVRFTLRPTTGRDGAGFEVVFILTDDENLPPDIVTTEAQRQVNGFVPAGWSGNPIGPTPQMPHEWVSVRTGKNLAWNEFSSPTPWANYALNLTVMDTVTLSNGDVMLTFSDGTFITIPAGQAGRGITNVVRDETTGIVTVTFDDGTSATFVLRDLANITRDPNTGVVTVTYSDGTTDQFTVADGTEVTVVSISTAANGDRTILFSDGNSFTIPAGQAGRGIDTIVRDATTGIVTVTFDDGTTATFALNDVASITRDPNTGVVTVTYSDGTTDQFTVADGTEVTVVSISTAANGDRTILFSDGNSFTIPAGQAGRGIDTIARDATTGIVTVTFDDGTTATFALNDVASITRDPNTGIVTITYSDGTTDQFTVVDGADGTSVTVVSISTAANGDRTILFSDGNSFTIPAGQAGRGIDTIVRDATTGIVTVTFDDGTTATFVLRDFASITRDPNTGIVTITYSDGTTDQFTVVDGADGTNVTVASISTAVNGDRTILFSDGNSITIPAGQAGRGIDTIARDATTGIVTVTFDDGTTATFALMDGEIGLAGITATGFGQRIFYRVNGDSSPAEWVFNLQWLRGSTVLATASLRWTLDVNNVPQYDQEVLSNGVTAVGGEPPLEPMRTRMYSYEGVQLEATALFAGQINDGDLSDPAMRGPSQFLIPITANHQHELSAMSDGVLQPGGDGDDRYVSLANSATTGSNVVGDFVIFYRENFSSAWSWSGTVWRSAPAFISAQLLTGLQAVFHTLEVNLAQIIDLSAIEIDASRITTGRLDADHIDSDVRNTAVLFSSAAGLSIDPPLTITLNDAIDNYDTLLFELRDASPGFEPSGIASIRRARIHEGGSNSGTSMIAFGVKKEANVIEGTTAYIRRPVGTIRSLVLTQYSSVTGGAVFTVLGFKNPTSTPPTPTPTPPTPTPTPPTPTPTPPTPTPTPPTPTPTPPTPTPPTPTPTPPTPTGLTAAANFLRASNTSDEYFVTFQYDDSNSFASPSEIYDTELSSIHIVDWTAPSGTSYIRARFTTAANDGGSQGLWSSTLTYTSTPIPTPSGAAAFNFTLTDSAVVSAAGVVYIASFSEGGSNVIPSNAMDDGQAGYFSQLELYGGSIWVYIGGGRELTSDVEQRLRIIATSSAAPGISISVAFNDSTEPYRVNVDTSALYDQLSAGDPLTVRFYTS